MRIIQLRGKGQLDYKLCAFPGGKEQEINIIEKKTPLLHQEKVADVGT